MRVLIAHGSKMGGTAGIANMIGEALTEAGIEADVRPAAEVSSLEGYDAAVVGGALYAMRWQRDARRFVKRHDDALRQMPVWLFSSGPLDDSAEKDELPATKQVARLAERVGARGHVTFGGRLPADAKGFPASTMAKEHAGDWRDPDHIHGWAAQIAAELTAPAPAA